MKFSLSQLSEVHPDILVLPVAKGTSFESFFSRVASLTDIPIQVLKADFRGEAKEIHTLYYEQAGKGKRLILLGLGERPGISDVVLAFRAFIFRRKKSIGEASVGIGFHFENVPDDNIGLWIEGAVNGFLLGQYDIGLYKTEKSAENALPGDIQVGILVEEKFRQAAEERMFRGQSIAETQLSIYDLVNAPANKKPPKVLADWALRSGKEHGYEVRIFDRSEIESLGLYALLAVNRGSEDPPAFIVMEYKPSGTKSIKKIGLVGKGVTFDTGGISIKPSNNMYLMKSDMGGAAAVMGTVEAAARLKLPFHIVGVIPATDNSVDAKAVKPGDVIGSYDGKTIEVIDTDAEGRLILADGLAYICRNFKPDILIDLATLTGSCIRAIGTYAGGLFTNNQELADRLLKSGQLSGERLWQFPMWDDYKKEMKSDIADVKNFSGSPAAGAITAAKFLEMFIQDHPAWAHMDIAGVAVADSEFSSQKSATAYGVRLLINYLTDLMPE